MVLPTIDIVASDTFRQYRQGFPSVYAGRGGFDWNLDYKILPLLPNSALNPSKPFDTAVMAGGLFAIHAQFFWELGAYDNGLETYGKLNRSILHWTVTDGIFTTCSALYFFFFFEK